jgi:hypothetical protein
MSTKDWVAIVLLLLAFLALQYMKYDRDQWRDQVITLQTTAAEQRQQIDRERAAVEERQARLKEQEDRNRDFEEYFDQACALDPELAALADVELPDDLYARLCGRAPR